MVIQVRRCVKHGLRTQRLSRRRCDQTHLLKSATGRCDILKSSMQEAAQLFSARTAVKHELELPQATERAAYIGPLLAPLALPPPPPDLEAQRPPPPEVPACPSKVPRIAVLSSSVLGSPDDVEAHRLRLIERVTECCGT